MKKITFIFSLLTTILAYSQSLPINFESGVTTSNFIDFDGGIGTVIANPSPSGINTSATVGRIVRTGGAIWAGSKIALSANLDFTTLTKISMKVFTTAPIGTTVKFKLEGAGSPVESDALTTTSGAWETLEWIFAGTPNNLNEIVFMFDFGNVGNGAASSTFYLDDIQQIAGPPAPLPATLPINFEGNVVSSDFLNFGGAGATVIPNPQINAGNPSATVCEIIRNGGEIWAGCRITLTSNLNFSTQWHITMKVFTMAPVGTRLKLKLEGAPNEPTLDYLTTVSGAWETATWNFDGTSNDFNKISFLFDFGNVGNGSASSTFLMDDIQQIVGPPLPTPNPTTLPISFETSVISSDFSNFYGAQTTVITNPQANVDNPSTKVGRFLRSGGQSWAQSRIQLTDYLDFSSNAFISMKVYTEAPIGTLLKLKVESTTSGAANEKDAYTSVTGEWETYYFNFTGDPPVYNVITLMLGYGSVGDAGPNSTFLFDDIDQTFDPATASLTTDLKNEGIQFFPNPVKEKFTILSDELIQEVTIFDLVGNEIERIQHNSKTINLSVIDYPKGVYIAEVGIGSEIKRVKFAVE